MTDQEPKALTPVTAQRMEARKTLLDNLAGTLGASIPPGVTLVPGYSTRMKPSKQFRNAVNRAWIKALKNTKRKKIKAKRKTQKQARRINR